jgi:hypothetical protein
VAVLKRGPQILWPSSHWEVGVSPPPR